MITKAMRFRICRPAGEDGSDNGGGQGEGGTDAGAGDDTGNEGEDDAAAAAAAVETEAKAMGWTPKDHFKGDPAKWRPADEFVERGKNMLPIVNAKVKRQEQQIAELTATVRDFAKHQEGIQKRAYDRALADLKEQRAAAIAAGDGAAFDKVDDAITELRKEVDIKQTAAKAGDDVDPVYDEWAGRNKWLADAEMADYGEFTAARMRKNGEKATGTDFLELVTKAVKAKFPEKFENPRRNEAGAVESGTPAPRRGGKSFADLPAADRAACERMAKNGFAGDAKAQADFKANYTKQYFEQEA